MASSDKVSYSKIKRRVDRILSGNVDLNSMTVKMLRLKVAEALGVTKKEVDKQQIKRAFREIALGNENTRKCEGGEEEEENEKKTEKLKRKKKKTTDKKRASGINKRKRATTSGKVSKDVSRSKSWRAITKLIRVAGIGPTIYQNLPDETTSKEIELVRRIRSRGFQVRGRYPSSGEISAAEQARALKLSLDGIDTSNIIEGSGKRRRRRTVRSGDFLDSEKHIMSDDAASASDDDAFEDEKKTKKQSSGERGKKSHTRKHIVVDDDSEEEFVI